MRNLLDLLGICIYIPRPGDFIIQRTNGFIDILRVGHRHGDYISAEGFAMLSSDLQFFCTRSSTTHRNFNDYEKLNSKTLSRNDAMTILRNIRKEETITSSAIDIEFESYILHTYPIIINGKDISELRRKINGY